MQSESIDRERFPSLKENEGEDPARFLDQELYSDHDARQLAFARIRGIDKFSVISAWKAVERALDRGPRQRVIDELNKREETLQRIGERPERTPDDPRVLPLLLPPERDSVEIEHADAAASKVRTLATDGGRSE